MALTELFATVEGSTYSLSQDATGRLWRTTQDYLMLASPATNNRWSFDRTVVLADIRSIGVDPDNPELFWIATKSGPFRYWPERQPKRRRKIVTLSGDNE